MLCCSLEKGSFEMQNSCSIGEVAADDYCNSKGARPGSAELSQCHSQCSMRVHTDSVVRHKDIILIAVSFEPPALSTITHWVAPELF